MVEVNKTNNANKKLGVRKDKNKQKASKEIVKKNNIPIPPEVFEKLPDDAKKSLSMMFSMQSITGRLGSPIIDKLTPEHIDSLITETREENQRGYKYATSNRIFTLIYAGLGLGLFIFLTYYFAKTNEKLYTEIVKILLAFGAGFLAGTGYKSIKK